MSTEQSTLNYDLWMAASVGNREAIAHIIVLWEEMQQRIAALEVQAQETPQDLHLNIPPKSSTPVTIHVTDRGRGTPQVVLPVEDEEEEARGIIALRAALALHDSHDSLNDRSGPIIQVNEDVEPLLRRIQWQIEMLNVYRQAVEEMLRER